MPKVKIPSVVVKQQANAIVRAAVDAFSSVRSQVELIGRLYGMLVEYLATLGQPLMRLRKVSSDSPPIASEYNDTMREIHDDLEVLTSESNLHKATIVADYNFAKTENSLLDSVLDGLVDRLRDVELYHGSKLVSLFARDSFNDMSKIDVRRVSGTLADVDTDQGIVTLKRLGSVERQVGATVDIIPGAQIEGTYGLLGSESNGFPGNMHELTVDPTAYQGPVESDDEKYKFVGEENAHVDRAAIVDGEPNTWFEYELVNLDQRYKDEAGGYGFAFDVPPDGQVRWDRDPDDGKLKLHLQVTLSEAALLNWIGVRLYVPPNDGAQPAVVEDIRISRDGVEVPTSIMEECEVSGAGTSLVFSFSPRTAKVVHFYFAQENRFEIAVGHIYYKHVAVIQRQSHYFFGLFHGAVRTETRITRIDGPNIPITGLGVTTINPNAELGSGLAAIGGLVWATAQIGAGLGFSALAASLGPVGVAIGAIGLLLAGLYSESVNVLRDDVESGVEMFPGWRYAIGIADLTLNTHTFEQKSEIVSIPYTSHMPIRSLTLRTNESVPLAFGQGRRWIRYYVSIDDGANWFEIAPLGVVVAGVPTTYRINARELPETRDPRVGYLEADGDIYAVRFKVVLERPTGQGLEYYTPVLYDYVLALGVDA